MRKFHLSLALLGIVFGWSVREMMQTSGSAGGGAQALVSAEVSSDLQREGKPVPAVLSPVSDTLSLVAAAPNAPAPGVVSAGKPAGRPQEWDRFEQWLERWRAAGAAEKLALEEEGVSTATTPPDDRPVVAASCTIDIIIVLAKS
jgi:hypothetical protein